MDCHADANDHRLAVVLSVCLDTMSSDEFEPWVQNPHISPLGVDRHVSITALGLHQLARAPC